MKEDWNYGQPKKTAHDVNDFKGEKKKGGWEGIAMEQVVYTRPKIGEIRGKRNPKDQPLVVISQKKPRQLAVGTRL